MSDNLKSENALKVVESNWSVKQVLAQALKRIDKKEIKYDYKWVQILTASQGLYECAAL